VVDLLLCDVRRVEVCDVVCDVRRVDLLVWDVRSVDPLVCDVCRVGPLVCDVRKKVCDVHRIDPLACDVCTYGMCEWIPCIGVCLCYTMTLYPSTFSCSFKCGIIKSGTPIYIYNIMLYVAIFTINHAHFCTLYYYL
jgi:hypothetical protein